MVFIEVQGYGDFDVVQTKSIWVNDELPKTFKVEQLNLGDVGADRSPDRIEMLLERQGFKRVYTQAVTFGGSY